MSGFLTNEAAKINIPPVCCRPAAFFVHTHSLHFPATVGYTAHSLLLSCSFHVSPVNIAQGIS